VENACGNRMCKPAFKDDKRIIQIAKIKIRRMYINIERRILGQFLFLFPSYLGTELYGIRF